MNLIKRSIDFLDVDSMGATASLSPLKMGPLKKLRGILMISTFIRVEAIIEFIRNTNLCAL